MHEAIVVYGIPNFTPDIIYAKTTLRRDRRGFFWSWVGPLHIAGTSADKVRSYDRGGHTAGNWGGGAV